MSAALPCAYGYSWRTLRYRPNWSSVTLSLQASSRSFWHLCPKHPFVPVTYWETMRGQGGVCTCLYKFLSMIKKKKNQCQKKKKKKLYLIQLNNKGISQRSSVPRFPSPSFISANHVLCDGPYPFISNGITSLCFKWPIFQHFTVGYPYHL